MSHVLDEEIVDARCHCAERDVVRHGSDHTKQKGGRPTLQS